MNVYEQKGIKIKADLVKGCVEVEIDSRGQNPSAVAVHYYETFETDCKPSSVEFEAYRFTPPRFQEFIKKLSVADKKSQGTAFLSDADKLKEYYEIIPYNPDL